MGSDNKTRIITAIVMLITLLLPGRTLAMNSEPRGTLVLLGNENLAPIVFNDNGVAKGVAVDIAKAIGNRIGYDIEVVPVDWQQAQAMVLNGEADGLLQINPSPERNMLYDFSAPLLRSDFSLFVRSGNTTLRNIDDLRGKLVGVEAGGYPGTLLRNYEGIDTVVIDDWKTSFRDLSNGGLDAIIVDRWIGEYELAQSRIVGITVVTTPIETQHSRIAVRKGDADTLALLNSGLIGITEDGTVDEILKQWQGKRVVYITEDYYQILWLRLASLFLLLVSTTAIYMVSKYRKLSQQLEASVKERTEELHRSNEMLKAANLKLERLSMIDGLTAIENRRAFDIAFNRGYESSLREGMPLALIMIDIDHFKVFNDTYGHIAGDQALIKIAGIIKDVIKRPGDLAARYGGEEFVVMLMNTTTEGAAIVAEEIRRRIEALGVENEKVQAVITVSLGVAAVVPNEKMAPEELIDAADRALYRAKEYGGNKVIVWEKEQRN